MTDLRKKIEAILFASGKKVTYEELARLCDSDLNEVKIEVQNLKKAYEERESPIILTEESDGWKMTIREKYLSIVHSMMPETELNKSVLETLAVIAWKHPVLQADVVKIRTNKAYDDIADLVDRGFIVKEKSGRSYSLKVTNKFKEYFELPNKEAIKQIFDNIQEHLKQEESLDEEKDHIGNLEVYDEEKEVQERPKIISYENKSADEEKEEADETGSEQEEKDVEEPQKTREDIERELEDIEEGKGLVEEENADEEVSEPEPEILMDDPEEKEIEKEAIVEKEDEEENGRKLSSELEEMLPKEKQNPEKEK